MVNCLKGFHKTMSIHNFEKWKRKISRMLKLSTSARFAVPFWFASVTYVISLNCRFLAREKWWVCLGLTENHFGKLSQKGGLKVDSGCYNRHIKRRVLRHWNKIKVGTPCTKFLERNGLFEILHVSLFWGGEGRWRCYVLLQHRCFLNSRKFWLPRTYHRMSFCG